MLPLAARRVFASIVSKNPYLTIVDTGRSDNQETWINLHWIWKDWSWIDVADYVHWQHSQDVKLDETNPKFNSYCYFLVNYERPINANVNTTPKVNKFLKVDNAFSQHHALTYGVRDLLVPVYLQSKQGENDQFGERLRFSDITFLFPNLLPSQ